MRDGVNFNDSMKPIIAFPEFKDLKSKRIVDVDNNIEKPKNAVKMKQLDRGDSDDENFEDDQMGDYKEGYIKRSKWRPPSPPPVSEKN